MDRNALRAAHTEIVLNVLTAGAVDHAGEAVQSFDILKKAHTRCSINRLRTLERCHDIFIGRVIFDDTMSPAGLRGTGKVLCSLRTPVFCLMANQSCCRIDLCIRLLHFLEGLFVQDHIRAESVQQGIQVIIVCLNRCCCQHNNGICIVCKITCNPVSTCIRVANVVSLINDHQVKMNRFFQIKQTFLAAFARKQLLGHQ